MNADPPPADFTAKPRTANASGEPGGEIAAASSAYPLDFERGQSANAAQPYRDDPAVQRLLEFFAAKGLAALKEEDRKERWDADWLAFQARHRLYADLLSPRQYATRGGCFDLLRYARFLEVFGHCSAAHGYSLHVSFLGFFAILMGENEALKREAAARLEAGELLAFGVSEQNHGSDLLANEFQIARTAAGQWLANGSKYYIGNANVATLISVLGQERAATDSKGPSGRFPLILAALRPQRGTPRWREEKINTLGVRCAHVGKFTVADHALTDADIIARGRAAWNALFGTITLGKFFLGFGAIGICERAFFEAAAHLKKRTLYGKSALEMPHLRSMMTQAFARLAAMKLYAYRTLDYVHAAADGDRRYQLFCAVQKARVSTEGVKVMGLLSECIGAKGFEADTFCEMALRDAALFPGLEGSMHINFGLAAQFLPRYFQRGGNAAPPPPSLLAGETATRENPYLMSARAGGVQAVTFGWFFDAYRDWTGLPNVALFVRQAAAFRRFARRQEKQRIDKSNPQISTALGHCLAAIVHAQLAAESASRLKIPRPLVSIIFALLVADLNAAAMQLALVPAFDAPSRALAARMVAMPATDAGDWDFVAGQLAALVP